MRAPVLWYRLHSAWPHLHKACSEVVFRQIARYSDLISLSCLPGKLLCLHKCSTCVLMSEAQ